MCVLGRDIKTTKSISQIFLFITCIPQAQLPYFINSMMHSFFTFSHLWNRDDLTTIIGIVFLSFLVVHIILVHLTTDTAFNKIQKYISTLLPTYTFAGPWSLWGKHRCKAPGKCLGHNTQQTLLPFLFHVHLLKVEWYYLLLSQKRQKWNSNSNIENSS